MRVTRSARASACSGDPATVADSGNGHFGLDGIRERLLNHKGELAIESAPGKGTTVSIFLKLNH